MPSSNPILVLIAFASFVSSFNPIQPFIATRNTKLFNSAEDSNNFSYDTTNSVNHIYTSRKAFLASLLATTTATVSACAANADEGEGFESIAARAAQISKAVEAQEATKEKENVAEAVDLRSVYDFSLPVAGEDVPFKDLIKQEFITTQIAGENEGETISKTEAKVKAILVVNIKQDDPIARKNIPELISLAAK